MRLYQIKKSLHTKVNNQESKEIDYRMGGNLCQPFVRGLISRIYKKNPLTTKEQAIQLINGQMI
jgi:hypothetical protein